MFGTVEYFVENFKSTIMNNLCSGSTITIKDIYDDLSSKINQVSQNADRDKYLKNLKKAYVKVQEEFLGKDEDC